MVLGCKDQILYVLDMKISSKAQKWEFRIRNMSKKKPEYMIKCRQYCTDNIWIPDIFAF